MQLLHQFKVVAETGLPRLFNKVQIKIIGWGPTQSMVMRRLASTVHPPRDPNTLSNYNNFITTHTEANLDIDFEQRCLAGFVKLNLRSVTQAETKQILLDTSFLDVSDVKVHGKRSKWELLSRVEPYGSALEIRLDEAVELDKSIEVNVQYT